MQFFVLAIWLIERHLLCFMEKFCFHVYILTNPCSLVPRVFCCTYFVQDLHFGLDKLSPRSIKCAFVGYSWTQKGYCWFNPANRKYFTSLDVIFFKLFHSFLLEIRKPHCCLFLFLNLYLVLEQKRSTVSKPLKVKTRRPKNFVLFQNKPNPASTTKVLIHSQQTRMPEIPTHQQQPPIPDVERDSILV